MAIMSMPPMTAVGGSVHCHRRVGGMAAPGQDHWHPGACEKACGLAGALGAHEHEAIDPARQERPHGLGLRGGAHLVGGDEKLEALARQGELHALEEAGEDR
jgi:hypothetical protein